MNNQPELSAGLENLPGALYEIDVDGIKANLLFDYQAFCDVADEYRSGADLTCERERENGTAYSTWNVKGQAVVLFAGYKNYCATNMKRLELSYENFQQLARQGQSEPEILGKIFACFIPFNYAWAKHQNTSFN
jgi:hypothetical protein